MELIYEYSILLPPYHHAHQIFQSEYTCGSPIAELLHCASWSTPRGELDEMKALQISPLTTKLMIQ